MRDLDVAAASEALIRWFDTQDIKPADAGVVMANVIASDLAECQTRGADADEGLALYARMIKEMVYYKLDNRE